VAQRQLMELHQSYARQPEDLISHSLADSAVQGAKVGAAISQ